MKVQDRIIRIEQELEANPKQPTIILTKRDARILLNGYNQYKEAKAETANRRAEANHYRDEVKSLRAQLNWRQQGIG